MIDPTEELIPLIDAVGHMPVSVRPPHVSTCVRWALRGVGSPRVRLETLKVGGRRYTSRAALARFIERLTGGEAGQAAADARQSLAMQRAKDDLDSEGV